MERVKFDVLGALVLDFGHHRVILWSFLCDLGHCDVTLWSLEQFGNGCQK